MAQHGPTHVASSQKALMLEMKSLQEEPVEGFRITLVDEADLYNWEVAIFGPPNTHYEGGYFKVSSTHRYVSLFCKYVTYTNAIFQMYFVCLLATITNGHLHCCLTFFTGLLLTEHRICILLMQPAVTSSTV